MAVKEPSPLSLAVMVPNALKVAPELVKENVVVACNVSDPATAIRPTKTADGMNRIVS
jgi:hypothetical protein